METVKEVMKSPVIGYGGPRPYDGPKLIPHLGTQGQFWLVLFSQGIVGAFFFVMFLIRLTVRPVTDLSSPSGVTSPSRSRWSRSSSTT